MQIPLTYCLILSIALVLVALLRRPWLIGVWVISLLLFPTAFARIGQAPVFLYDGITALVFISFWVGGDRSWPSSVPRWHWWFIGSAFVLSVVGGMLRYGAAPEIVWIWGHASLAWLAFSFAVLICTSKSHDQHCGALRAGIFISSVVLCSIALIQYADLPGAGFLTLLFYDDLGRAGIADILQYAEVNRALGPHSSPPGFAGIALLALLAFWVLNAEGNAFARWIVLITSSVTILCTVSRHAMLAAAIGLIVALVFSEPRKRIRLLAVSGLVVLALGVLAGNSFFRNGWSHRMAKTEEGILEDDNIAARVVWGPVRLAQFVARSPAVLLTGAGLDPEKLEARSKIDSFESGFVSNGFLLALYYMGVFGFVLFAAFWYWTLRTASARADDTRAVAIASVVTACVLVFSDNYGFIYKPAVALLFLIAGLVAGRQYHSEDELLEVEESASANSMEHEHAA